MASVEVTLKLLMTSERGEKMDWKRWLSLAVGVALMIVASLGLVQYFAPSTQIAPERVTSKPIVTMAPPLPAASVSPSASVTPSVSPWFADPVGMPDFVTVERPDGEVYISTKVTPDYLRPNGEWVPPKRLAGWYAMPGWPTPGTLSDLPAVIAGHATCGAGCRDIFFRLSEARVGDVVQVHFSSGDVTVFRLTQGWTSVGKDDMTVLHDAEGNRTSVYDAWQLPDGERGQKLTLITCDTESGYSGGHSINNGYVLAERIS